jgi:hypothetical protein
MTMHPDQLSARALTRDFRSAPTATRTRDLLLRRYPALSAVATCEDAGQVRAS